MTRDATLSSWRLWIIGSLLVTVALSHWLLPTSTPVLHVFHILLRKMFLLPVLVAAIWFNLRGALTTAAVATALFLPHVLRHWSGQLAENQNQVGEIASIWLTAVVAGILVDKEKAARIKLVATTRGVLLALVKALDARERETEAHSLRVSAIAARLGWKLGLQDEQLKTLVDAAVLHDIGKIGIEDRILLKPGPLSEDEWQRMKQHPLIGYRILEPIPQMECVAEAVLSHHERYDGGGYPRGLKADQVPLAARVFAVADAFDAMTTSRSYRSEPLSYGAARDVLLEERGKQFDPEAVDAFLELPQEEWSGIGGYSEVLGPEAVQANGYGMKGTEK